MIPPKEHGDHLLQMLPFAMPWKKGVAILLVAYFDASARESDMFSVAGIAFTEDGARAAMADWVDLWGETRCHMTDLHSGRKRPGNPFYGWTDDQAAQRLKDSVAIINRHAGYATATSCRASDIAKLGLTASAPGTAHFLDAFSAAYPTCLNLAMSALTGLLTKAGDDSNIAYFIEKGDLNQGSAIRYLAVAQDDQVLKQHYRHESHTVISKECARLFETVDILAWEWAKHMERLMQGKKMRGSLRALLGEGESGETDFKSPTRRAFHNAGPVFEQYVRDLKTKVLN